MHESTFQYLKPTEQQLCDMAEARGGFTVLAERLDRLLPDGPDKTYTLRRLRECAMWVMVAITRDADGSPRQ